MGDFKSDPGCFKEAVCIQAERIYDSCSDKDCLEDLEVIFLDEPSKQIIDSATFVKCKCVEVINTFFTIEPVPFNKGFYSIDITYIFKVVIEAFVDSITPPSIVKGETRFCKKVILYGSDGNAKVFTSEEPVVLTSKGCCHKNLPTATVQVVEPIVLDIKLVTKTFMGGCDCYCPMPMCGADDTDAASLTCPPMPCKKVFITLGLFSIVSLQRPVQLLVPAYDFCIPHKDCSTTNDSPCELFEKIKFPTDEFFPPSLEDIDSCEDGDRH